MTLNFFQWFSSLKVCRKAKQEVAYVDTCSVMTYSYSDIGGLNDTEFSNGSAQ